MLPDGYVSSRVIDMIDMILAWNNLPRITRQDRIRGYIAIPKDAVNDVVMSLKANGLVA